MANIKAFLKRWWKGIIIGIFTILLIGLAIYYLRSVRGLVWADWTGIENKTLWDLLELLIIPAFLGFIAYLFSRYQNEKEQKRTDQRAQDEREAADKRAKIESDLAVDLQREEALQNYLDKMSELLIEKKLLETIAEGEDESIMVVARGRTVSTLRMLNRDRQNILLSFVRDAKLADHILIGASLHNSDLNGAYLWKINLSGANLSGADLRRADLIVTILSGADLSGAYLRKAKLWEANLRRANLSGADLREANLSGADLSVSNLMDTDLSGAILSGADLSGANLSGARLSGARLRNADLSEANLWDTDLSEANLWKVNLSRAKLNDADLRDADLRGADLRGAYLRGTNLHGAIFIDEQLQLLVAKSLQDAIMPDGTLYDGRFDKIEGESTQEVIM